MQTEKQNLKNSAHGSTDVKGKEFIYTWHINNFNSLCIHDIKNIESPKFITNVDEEMSWALLMNSCETNSEYLSIVLSMYEKETKSTKRAHLTISVIDYKGKEKIAMQSSFIPKYGDLSGRSFSTFVKKDYVKDAKNKLLLNGILTIRCMIFFVDEFVKESDSTTFQIRKPCNCNLKALYETKKLSDTILIVGAEKFATHKCILAARSKVFSAMFEHDMKEKNANTVNIDDVEPQVIEEMLQYIYCGKIEGFQDVTNLLIAADKYGINDLKSICEDQLINDINVKNVGKTLILADLYKADSLKKRILHFIVMHPSEINFEQFKKDVESYSPLLADMLHSLM